MGVEWGEQHSSALDDLGELIDRVTESYHRLRDSLRNPPRPRTKRARELVRGDVVQFNGNRHVVEHVGPDRHGQDRAHVCWQDPFGCTTYPADAEIALVAS